MQNASVLLNTTLYSVFYEEYESGNFDNEGNRVLSLSELKQGQQELEVTDEPYQDEDLSVWYELFNIAAESV